MAKSTLEVWDRQDRAAEMRRNGETWPNIAKELGYASPRAAITAVEAAVERSSGEAAAEIRQHSLARLDEVYKVLRRVMLHPPRLAQQGATVTDETGAPVYDAKVSIDAGNAIVKLEERRARLVGLDAPVRRTLEVITDDVLAELIREQAVETERLEARARAMGLDPAKVYQAAAIEARAVEREPAPDLS